MKKIIGILGICAILALGVWLSLSGRGTTDPVPVDDLRREFANYITAAFVPGTQSNPVLNELNVVLGEILTSELSAEDRILRSERGLELLDVMESQIDRIGESRDALMILIDRLQAEGTITDDYFGSAEHDLADSAEKLTQIAGDIRALSYRSNYSTGKIFKRVLGDGGELTPAHIQDLNNEIPEVEKDFDTRSNLYLELEALNTTITDQLANLERSRSSQFFPAGIFRQ